MRAARAKSLDGEVLLRTRGGRDRGLDALVARSRSAMGCRLMAPLLCRFELVAAKKRASACWFHGLGAMRALNASIYVTNASAKVASCQIGDRHGQSLRNLHALARFLATSTKKAARAESFDDEVLLEMGK